MDLIYSEKNEKINCTDLSRGKVFDENNYQIEQTSDIFNEYYIKYVRCQCLITSVHLYSLLVKKYFLKIFKLIAQDNRKLITCTYAIQPISVS